MLLIQGKKKDVEYLEAEKFFITLSEYEKKKTIYRKAIPAILIGIGVVLAAALNIVNILISAMIGALLMIFDRRAQTGRSIQIGGMEGDFHDGRSSFHGSGPGKNGRRRNDRSFYPVVIGSIQCLCYAECHIFGFFSFYQFYIK